MSAAVARLEALRAVRAAEQAEAAEPAEISARLSYSAKETVEWLYKHQVTCSRSLSRTFDELRKVRRDFGDDLLDSPGPLSDVRCPSSESERVEGPDLLATAPEPTAFEPAHDDARNVTNEAIALAESVALSAVQGQHQWTERTKPSPRPNSLP